MVFEVVTLEEFTIILTLVGAIALETIFILLILMWTPAMTFFNKKPKLWIPGDDRTGKFETIKVVGGMGTTKDGRTYHLNKDHFWKDQKSGNMIAVAYSTSGHTLDPRIAPAIAALKAMGVNTWGELKKADEENKKQETDIIIPLEPEPGKIKRWFAGKKPKEMWLSELVELIESEEKTSGKTINLSEIITFMPGNVRADLTEARIQHRVAVEEKLAGKKDVFKWIIALSIIIIVGTLAFVMIMSVTSPGAGVSPEAIAKAVAQGLAEGQAKVVGGAQDAGAALPGQNITAPTGLS